MSKKNKIYLILTGLVFFFLITSGAVCKGGDPNAQQKIKQPITLNYWRVYDGSSAFQDIINSYRLKKPNITIKYRLLRWEEYERELVNAWAEGRGPDIFSIHNSWTYKYQNKIFPLPDKLTVALLISGGRNPEAAIQTYPTLRPSQLQDKFPQVIYNDAIINGKIYGLPLSIDTLSLYYNQNILDAAGITAPPMTWIEVAEVTKQITKQDNEGDLSVSGIALGGAYNVNRAPDVLSLLMLQNGTQMISGRRATFNQPASFSRERYYPGIEALRFYADFAKVSKEVYTWNESLKEAEKLFLAGKLGMMPGYSYQLPLLRSQGPKLNIRLTQIPHINPDGTDALGQPINYANYWLETVYKHTKHPNEAWDFVHSMTLNQDEAQKYIKATRKPAALRALISQQLKDPELGIFASQALTSRTWYHGSKPELFEQIFRQMIDQVVSRNIDIRKAINFGIDKINQIL